MVTIECNNVGKRYFYRWVFVNLSLRWSGPGIFGVGGHNGAGKSTLLKILSGIAQPSAGKVSVQHAGKEFYPDRITQIIGYAAPYIHVYQELTPLEHLKLIERLRNVPLDWEYAYELLDHFNLSEVKTVPLYAFSTGMLQRYKIVLAAVHRPPLLLFDEPTANLDQEGIQQFSQLLLQCGKQSLVVLASNTAQDFHACTEYLNIEQYHPHQDRPR